MPQTSAHLTGAAPSSSFTSLSSFQQIGTNRHITATTWRQFATARLSMTPAS